MENTTNGPTMKFSLTIIALAFVLSGCANQQQPEKRDVHLNVSQRQSQWDNFAGHWRTQRSNDIGGKNTITIKRFKDGRYVIQFKIFDKQEILKEEHREMGLWGISGDIYFTMFKGWIENDRFQPANSSKAAHYNAYQIIEHGADKLIYKSLSSDNTFSYQRIETLK